MLYSCRCGEFARAATGCAAIWHKPCPASANRRHTQRDRLPSQRHRSVEHRFQLQTFSKRLSFRARGHFVQQAIVHNIRQRQRLLGARFLFHLVQIRFQNGSRNRPIRAHGIEHNLVYLFRCFAVQTKAAANEVHCIRLILPQSTDRSPVSAQDSFTCSGAFSNLAALVTIPVSGCGNRPPAKTNSLKPLRFIREFHGTGMIAASIEPTSIAAMRTDAAPMEI